MGRGALAALALAVSGVAGAGTFSLPPGQSRPSSAPAGPIDPDNPVVIARPRPQPSAQPSAAPTSPAAPPPAATRPAPQAQPSATSQPRPTRATPTPLPTRPQVQPAPGATPVPGPSADPFALPTAIPTAAPAPTASSALPAPTPSVAAEPDDGGRTWSIVLGVLALLAAGAGYLFRRRRSEVIADPVVVFEKPVVPAAPVAPVATPEPEAEPAAPPAAQVAAAPSDLIVSIEARRLNASLVAATLSYQLKVTNTGDTTLDTFEVEADMVAAHASLPIERQIAAADQHLELRHKGGALAPGESAEFSGEFRVPLAAITPIRRGDAAFFVPLARLRVDAARAAAKALTTARTFVIGELPEKPGGALKPFRLDLGPRTFSRLGQRPFG